MQSLEGLDMVGRGERDGRIEGLKRFYGLGWTRDGQLKVDDVRFVEVDCVL